MFFSATFSYYIEKYVVVKMFQETARDILAGLKMG